MKIIADLTKGELFADICKFKISCNVRTLKNGKRTSSEVIRTIPGNFPYDPQPFPKGVWNITAIEWQKDKKFNIDTYGPVKIRTDASQMVNVWELDADGDYFAETEKKVKDEAYLFHYSTSSTTLGCIRMNSADDAIILAGLLQKYLDRGEAVQLEVI